MTYHIFNHLSTLISIVYIYCLNMYCSSLIMNSANFYRFLSRNGTLVIGDSRCCCLQGTFKDGDIIVYAYRGAGILTVVDKAKSLIKRHDPVACLLLCGINDMTTLNRSTRVIKPRLYDAFDLANLIIGLLLQARRELVLLFPEVRIIFGGIIGVALNTYNNLTGVSPSQIIVDDAITQINSYIRLLNQLVLTSQPRMTSKVHCWRKGIRTNYYHLLRDGLHLGPTVRETWIREITNFHVNNSATASLCSVEPTWATVNEPS